MRQFFLVYSASPSPIRQTASSELQITDNKTNAIQQRASTESYGFTLSWSHYLILMRIENPAERSFYEIEAMWGKGKIA